MGCFLADLSASFDRLNGGAPGSGTLDLLAFYGAGLVSGDLRFFGPSPLQTPRAFQVMTGPCAEVPNIQAVNRARVFFESGFGDYVRARGKSEICNDPDVTVGMQFATDLQGGSWADPEPETVPLHAWLFFEFEITSMAAGWFEGMSVTEQGTPRPPLCHYQ
jgi:hypothetical protein